MLLQNQLSTIRMSKKNTMVSYLTKIIELKDQFAAIRAMLEVHKFVYVALK